MRLKKSTYALLLSGGLSIFNVGCAAVDAIVSSPAGNSATSSSPHRVAAIGRVFENKGRYAQARAMYRQALRNDPGNSVARDRLDYLASSQSTIKSQAVVVAGTVVPGKAAKTAASTHQTKTKEADNQPNRDETLIQMVRAFDSSGHVESASLSVGGQFEDGDAELPVTTINVEEEAVVADVSGHKPTESQDPVSAIEKDSKDTHWADSVTEVIAVTSRQDAFEESVVSASVPFEAVQSVSTTVDSSELFSKTANNQDEGLWRPARTHVSLAQVLTWSETPQQHTEQLIAAIQRGEDEGVKALSVALLGEVDHLDSDTFTALKQAANTGSPMVKAAALDALVVQGKSDSESVDGLLGLLAGDDPNIRTQAAASLLSMADTKWRSEAISGLTRLLDDPNDEVIAVVATSLSEFGEAAIPCRDRLTEIAATTSSDMVLEATSMALSRIPRSE